MFESLRNFFEFLGVHPFWPSLVAGLSILYGLFPYEPVAKIKETKDENGKKTYIIYKRRKWYCFRSLNIRGKGKTLLLSFIFINNS